MAGALGSPVMGWNGNSCYIWPISPFTAGGKDHSVSQTKPNATAVHPIRGRPHLASSIPSIIDSSVVPSGDIRAIDNLDKNTLRHRLVKRNS